MRTLVWYRGKDLRISDHAPLADAIERGEVITVFVLDPFFFSKKGAESLAHRMQFLLESLEALRGNLAARGGELLLAPGRVQEVIPRLARQFKVDRVSAYRWTEPFGRLRDGQVRSSLDVPLDLFEGETLLPPSTVRTKTNTPYSVYTPFARAAQAELGALTFLPPPKRIPPPPVDLVRKGLCETLPNLENLGIKRNGHLLPGGEARGRERFKTFLGRLQHYEKERDLLAESGTSRLSADLKFGTLSLREVYRRVSITQFHSSREKFIAQLLWREFAYACLWDRPELSRLPFKSAFLDFPWSTDEGLWRAWKEGRTGYPIVDASARQLLKEGYVHNRARMISASFLTKHLLIDYRLGEAHYLQYLADGDWAINNMGWQWSAGCGVDAQPYFRVFNPTAQGQKFDQHGEYVKRYLPILAQLPSKYIHCPWEAPARLLREAGIELGRDYPAPIVEHRGARERFLSLAKQHLHRKSEAG